MVVIFATIGARKEEGFRGYSYYKKRREREKASESESEAAARQIKKAGGGQRAAGR